MSSMPPFPSESSHPLWAEHGFVCRHFPAMLCASVKVLAVSCCTCCVITSLSASQFYRDEVKKVMPSMSFSEMIKILENFLSFLDFAVS